MPATILFVRAPLLNERGAPSVSYSSLIGNPNVEEADCMKLQKQGNGEFDVGDGPDDFVHPTLSN